MTKGLKYPVPFLLISFLQSEIHHKWLFHTNSFSSYKVFAFWWKTILVENLQAVSVAKTLASAAKVLLVYHGLEVNSSD